MTGHHAVEAPEAASRRIATAAAWVLVCATMTPAVIVLAVLLGMLWLVARGMTVTELSPRGRHDGRAVVPTAGFESAPGGNTVSLQDAA